MRGGQDPQANAALAALPGGGTLVAWEETAHFLESPQELAPLAPPETAEAAGESGGAEALHSHAGHAPADGGSQRLIVLATYRASQAGQSRSSPNAVLTFPSFQTRPTIAVAPDGSAVIAWNDLREPGKQIVLVKLPPQEAP
jgi:hypothetical protein